MINLKVTVLRLMIIIALLTSGMDFSNSVLATCCKGLYWSCALGGFVLMGYHKRVDKEEKAHKDEDQNPTT